MAEIEKLILRAPDLPAVVKGDGRYVMSLLRDFLLATAEQVNIANGFTAEEIQSTTNVQTPKNFLLTFDRLGARFSWDQILKIETLFYYELRMDTNVGSMNGLLERTIETTSTKIPAQYSADVYLYAVTKDGEASSPAKISYNKPRPEEPEDVALTKNSEGTLITFLEIPTNCIGANVYVNNYKYETCDNIFLYPSQDTEQIKTVEVAYFDVFGEGERAVLNTYLPDVTGLLVERNGDSLDFYWEPLNIHGVEYVVRLGASPVWESAVEIFRTKLNKKKYICPKTGEYYLLVKAIDEHNNYSINATWVSTINGAEINRNVILSFDQESVLYNGSKINTYYDATAEALKLEQGALYGEYITRIDLPQQYRARNWLDYQCTSMVEETLIWDEAVFLWNSDDALKLRWEGKSIDNAVVEVTTQLAEYLDGVLPDNVIDAIPLDGTLTSAKETSPTENQKADAFANGRWGNGLMVTNLTRVSYELDIPQVFSMSFCAKQTESPKDCVYLTLKNDTAWLMLGQSKGKIFLRGSDGISIEIVAEIPEREWLTFGVSQGENTRSLFVHSLTRNKTITKTKEALSLGKFDKLFLRSNIGGNE